MRLKTVPIELQDDELLCVVGPTASQKTELAIRLCEETGGQVVSADSVQVYQHFDLGSGKPTAGERARAQHHLIDEVDPRQPLDAAQFAERADAVITRLRGQGVTPVLCGGTFLWVRALIYGLAQAPAGTPELRAQLELEAKEHGAPALHARLAEVDPVLAAQLSPNDYVRIERGLEVYLLSGRALSSYHAEHKAQPPRYRARFVGVGWDKAVLEQRIRARVQKWLSEGWIEEVQQLVKLGLGDTRAMGSVGYRQVLSHLEGELERGQLEDEIVRATKIYARRQRTWLRDVAVTWVAPLL